MAALVQSFPQQSSTITMLQARPSTASGPFQTGGQTQQQIRASQMPRNVYNLSTGSMAPTSYRGHTSMAPIAPYAFTSTPVLANSPNPLRQNPTTPHLRTENRTSSAPIIPQTQQTHPAVAWNQPRQRQSVPFSASTPSPDSSGPASAPGQQASTRDDFVINTQRTAPAVPRPLSSIELGLPDFNPSGIVTTAKPSPDRYRRSNRRADTNVPIPGGQTSGGSALPSGSGMATVGHLYNQPIGSAAVHSQLPYRGSPLPPSQDGMHHYGLQPKPVSKDDSILNRQSSSELAKRYRRRSVSSLDAGEFANVQFGPREQVSATKTPAAAASNPYSSEKQEIRKSPRTSRPSSCHGRNGSDESMSSVLSHSRPSSSKRESGGAVAPANPTAIGQGTPLTRHEAKLVTIPPRGSSDANKRLTSPSPLSKPINMASESASAKNPVANLKQPIPRALEVSAPPNVAVPESPAAQHLAALNKKEAKKEGKSSRLRRAFSFGSAAELRKASAENNHQNNVSVERARLRKDRYQDEQDAEQAAIAQKQEAAGLGEGIYSGQGHFFTGSTDNLSISSTASSASIMIRKMGKGMKKSSRSLVGLFRPKSVIGVPTADATVPEPSVAQVSMVTVEAEREKVNVNIDPHDHEGGGTGFPKLGRNSIDAASLAAKEPSLSLSDRSSDHVRPRRSIVGSEGERADVLAAVKKGILKRSGTDSGSSSPVQKPVDAKSAEFTLPQLPRFNDSPGSSAPSTPGDDHLNRSNHRRTDSVTIEGEDYFMSLARFANGESKSVPGTPRSIIGRNISFSPRIQFHDTWPSGEYDRRGEIATCNRLTPMLAQQIKEELNTFKMEMEVHEQSKVYTHFF